ncbi:MAG: aminoacyl-tRNA hydrolase [Acidimicrobiales bacterium]|nr:aminoacyl-tRNA hydrolase [Acidimicrobiales bacterium]
MEDSVGDIQVTRSVAIPRGEVDVRFTTSGGPGGQHANKTATRVELRFDVEASAALNPDQKARIVGRLGPVVRVVVDDERSQLRNRALAYERLAARLASALHVERPRRATRPSKGAKERRLQAKRQRSETKQRRRPPTHD